jgi:hypothetical protein
VIVVVEEDVWEEWKAGEVEGRRGVLNQPRRATWSELHLRDPRKKFRQ